MARAKAPGSREPSQQVVSAVPASIPRAEMPFNLNEQVSVKLTPRGLEILKEQHDSFRAIIPSIGGFKPPPQDEDGWSKWQLWDLIHTFGAHVSLGLPVAFETTIKLHLASGIEARSDETPKSGSAEGESPMAKPDARP